MVSLWILSTQNGLKWCLRALGKAANVLIIEDSSLLVLFCFVFVFFHSLFYFANVLVI